MTPAAAPLLLLLALLPPAPAGAGDPATALAEGDRRFTAGDLDGALLAYAAGAAASRPDPLLAYNLGSTAQHLGRLPEAVLWYRRAALGLPDDRWLEDNLALARAELQRTGVPPPAGPTVWSLARGIGRPLLVAGIVFGWAALPLLLLPARRRRRLVATAAVLAIVAFAAGAALPRAAPRPAVLLAPCTAALPAGSEVWVRPGSAGRFRVVDGPVCSAAAVGLVEP